MLLSVIDSSDVTFDPPTRRQRAMTLLELLVVIAIMSLLIAILLPALSGARQIAQGGVCLANLRRLGTSSILYLQRSDGRFAPFRLKTIGGETYVNAVGREKPRWQWFLGLDLGPVINPPTDSNAPWGDSVSRTMTNDYFLCPSLVGEGARDIRNGAYGYNYQYLGNSRRDTTPSEYDRFPVCETEITAPAETVLIADSRGASADHGKHSYALDPPRLAVEQNATRFGPGPADGPIQHSPAEARHRGRASAAWIDGHAESIQLEALGYALGPDGVVVPHKSLSRGAVSNRLWTGLGADPL